MKWEVEITKSICGSTSWCAYSKVNSYVFMGTRANWKTIKSAQADWRKFSKEHNIAREDWQYV